MATPKRNARRQPVAATVEPKCVLPAGCTIRQARELKETLLPLVDVPQSLQIDAAAVEQVDSAGLQLLTALWRERRSATRPTEWVATSAALRAGAATLGLTADLGLEG